MVNTYLDTLLDFQRAFGGTVSPHNAGDEKSRLTWEWRCYGDTAAQALATMLPLLREKAAQAYLGLHFRALPPHDTGRSHTRNALGLLKKTTHHR